MVEGAVEGLRGDFNRLDTSVSSFSGKLDQLVDAMQKGDSRTAERAQAVKFEIREEAQRKGQERSALFRDGLALVGAVAVIVTALGGPYVAKINATADGRGQDAAAISAVREVLAAQGAEIGRNTDQGTAMRDRVRHDEDAQADISTRLAHLEGSLSR